MAKDIESMAKLKAFGESFPRKKKLLMPTCSPAPESSAQLFILLPTRR
jgi:hypothetical protein